MPWLLTARLDRLFFSHLVRGLEQYKSCGIALAEECSKENLETRSRNVFDFLLEKGRAGADQQLSLPELISESSLLMIAGT